MGNQESRTTNYLTNVWFNDSNTGTVVGFYGTILHTTNGGTTWLPQVSGTSAILYTIFCLDNNLAWTVGWSGTVKESSGITLII